MSSYPLTRLIAPSSNLNNRRPVTVGELADIIDEKPVAVIKFLMTDLGVMASMTQSLDPATCVAVAEGFGKIVDGDDEDFDDDDEEYVSSANPKNMCSQMVIVFFPSVD